MAPPCKTDLDATDHALMRAIIDTSCQNTLVGLSARVGVSVQYRLDWLKENGYITWEESGNRRKKGTIKVTYE